MTIIYPGLNSLFKVSGTNCVNSYKYENKSWSETDIYKTRMPSPSRALPPAGGGVAWLPAAAADAVENVAAAVVEEAAVEVHIQVEVGQGREALEDPEDQVDPVTNPQKVRKAKPFQHWKRQQLLELLHIQGTKLEN